MVLVDSEGRCASINAKLTKGCLGSLVGEGWWAQWPPVGSGGALAEDDWKPCGAPFK